jgi:hypothetical protein
MYLKQLMVIIAGLAVISGSVVRSVRASATVPLGSFLQSDRTMIHSIRLNGFDVIEVGRVYVPGGGRYAQYKFYRTPWNIYNPASQLARQGTRHPPRPPVPTYPRLPGGEVCPPTTPWDEILSPMEFPTDDLADDWW